MPAPTLAPALLGPAAPARRLRGSFAVTAERPPRGGSASAAAPPAPRPSPRPHRPARPLPPPAPLPSRRGRGRSSRGSAVLRRGRPRPLPPPPPHCLRSGGRTKRPVPVRPGPPCGDADVRNTGRRRRGNGCGSVPGAGTYAVRPALAALTSRRIRPRRDAPQPLRYPGAAVSRCSGAAAAPLLLAAPVPPALRCPPVPRPPRCSGVPASRCRGRPAAAAAPRRDRRQAAGRRCLGAEAPAETRPSAALSPSLPPPPPSPPRHRSAPAERGPGAAPCREPWRWDGVAGQGARRGQGSSGGDRGCTEGKEGLQPG